MPGNSMTRHSVTIPFRTREPGRTSQGGHRLHKGKKWLHSVLALICATLVAKYIVAWVLQTVMVTTADCSSTYFLLQCPVSLMVPLVGPQPTGLPGRRSLSYLITPSFPEVPSLKCAPAMVLWHQGAEVPESAEGVLLVHGREHATLQGFLLRQVSQDCPAHYLQASSSCLVHRGLLSSPCLATLQGMRTGGTGLEPHPRAALQLLRGPQQE